MAHASRILFAALSWLALAGGGLADTLVASAAPVTLAEDRAWNAVKYSTDTGALADFIVRFPNGAHTGLAERRLELLRQPVVAGVFVGPLPPAASPAEIRSLIAACAAEAASPYEVGYEAIGVLGYRMQADAAIAACEAAYAAAPQSGEARTWLARALLSTRRAEALRLLEQSVAAGSIHATFLLGAALQGDDRDPATLARSAALLKEAADAGFVPAWGAYGRALQRGWGVPADPDAGLAFHLRAAEAGDPVAANDAAFALSRDNPAEALRLALVAVEAGVSSSGVIAGIVLYNGGPGVKRDHARALAYFEAAADAGEPGAYFTLGMVYVQGAEGVAANAGRAAAYFARGADLGHAKSAVQLAKLTAAGNGVTRDLGKARELAARAAALGDAEGRALFAKLGDDPEIVAAIQSRLANADCDPGTADGNWGPRSEAALLRFGKSAGTDLSRFVPSAELLRLIDQKDGVTCTL